MFLYDSLFDSSRMPASPALKWAVRLGWVPGHAWRAFVISLLWRWFAVPLGLPAVSVLQVLGIASAVALLRTSLFVSVEREGREWREKEYWKALAVLFGGPAMALGLGYLYLYLGTF